MTADELLHQFNETPYEVVQRDSNENTGKYACLDMETGEWTFDIPEGYVIGEKPFYVNSTKLSEVLQSDVDEKYYLSAKACRGILRRAKERGKELPDVLRIALENQANLGSE